MTNKKLNKYILSGILIISLCIPTLCNADDEMQYTILPEIEDTSELNKAVQEIGSTGGKVWETYTAKAENLTLEEQLASGIMNRDTLINYITYFVKFLSQIGITVGAVLIVYAGYKYMLSVFNGGKAPSSIVSNAIIGVLIVVFSYGILRIITSIVGFS